MSDHTLLLGGAERKHTRVRGTAWGVLAMSHLAWPA
jgi:hypothetical protein